MTIAADVDAQVTLDSTTRDAAIAAATSKVSGHAFGFGGVTIVDGSYESTDAIITEIAIRMLHRHQDNLKFQGLPQTEFNPTVVLTTTDKKTIERTVRRAVMSASTVSSSTSPTGKGLNPWSNPNWNQ